jgi:hypothetical protein
LGCPTDTCRSCPGMPRYMEMHTAFVSRKSPVRSAVCSYMPSPPPTCCAKRVPCAVVLLACQFLDSFKLRCAACSPDKATAVVDALVFDPPSLRGSSNARPAPCCTGDFAIVSVELSVKLRLLVALYSDCQVALCTVGKKGLKQSGGIRVERWLNSGDAMCTSVASDQQILAVGCSRGVVELYDLAENARLMRTVSLFDWG